MKQNTTKDMKKIIENIIQKEIIEAKGKTISRKEAIKKGGYFALSVATTMILLSNPLKGHAEAESSPAPPPSF